MSGIILNSDPSPSSPTPSSSTSSDRITTSDKDTNNLINTNTNANYNSNSNNILNNERIIPEVELYSLLNDRLPQYHVRMDSSTQFIGYQNQDWSRVTNLSNDYFPMTSNSLLSQQTNNNLTQALTSPTLNRPSSAASSSRFTGGSIDSNATCSMSLSDEQIERTLDYFLLCRLRMEQITHTYDDIDAVLQLLDEKERDLELAAQIGQTLLSKNKELFVKEKLAHDQVNQLIDQNKQLRHELNIKEDLLKIYMNDLDDSDPDLSHLIDWDMSAHDSLNSSHSRVPTTSSDSSAPLPPPALEQLRKRILTLEDDNDRLRTNHSQLFINTQHLEEQEQNLVKDCVRQLTEANAHIKSLSDSLANKAEKLVSLQEELTICLTKSIDLESQIKQFSYENDLLTTQYHESQKQQQQLYFELMDLRDRYDECVSMLNSCQDEVRRLRRRERKMLLDSQRHHILSNDLFQHSNMVNDNPTLTDPAGLVWTAGSLAYEMHDAMRRDLIDKHSSAIVDVNQRSMDQARLLNQNNQMISSGGGMSGSCFVDSCYGDTGGTSSDYSLSRWSTAETEACDELPVGHMSDALRRDCERVRAEPTIHRRRLNSEDSDVSTNNDSDIDVSVSPLVVSSVAPPVPPLPSLSSIHSVVSKDPLTSIPDSHMRSILTLNSSRNTFKMPDKLQLVKPLEGSSTLRHWQRLATPNFATALFETQRPGVRHRRIPPLHSPPISPQPTPMDHLEDTETSSVEIDDSSDDTELTPRSAGYFPHNLSHPHANSQSSVVVNYLRERDARAAAAKNKFHSSSSTSSQQQQQHHQHGSPGQNNNNSVIVKTNPSVGRLWWSQLTAGLQRVANEILSFPKSHSGECDESLQQLQQSPVGLSLITQLTSCPAIANERTSTGFLIPPASSSMATATTSTSSVGLNSYSLRPGDRPDHSPSAYEEEKRKRFGGGSGGGVVHRCQLLAPSSASNSDNSID